MVTQSSKSWHLKHPDLLKSVMEDMAFRYPSLLPKWVNGQLCFEGKLPLVDENLGEIDCFDIRIVLDKNYPDVLPKVFETGDRIPIGLDRHMLKGKECCLSTPIDLWAFNAIYSSLTEFVKGPVTDYFISQACYEINDKWPFGEYSHGKKGVLESLFLLFGTNDEKAIIGFLEILAKKEIRGHWLCPCGSKLQLRKCHSSKTHDAQRIITQKRALFLLDYLAKNTSHTKSVHN